MINESLAQTIGQNIADRRKAMKMSQQRLGYLIEESGMTISRWETAARNPSIEDLIKISKGLNCTFDELVCKPQTMTEAQTKLMDLAARLPQRDIEELLLLARYKLGRR